MKPLKTHTIKRKSFGEKVRDIAKKAKKGWNKFSHSLFGTPLSPENKIENTVHDKKLKKTHPHDLIDHSQTHLHPHQPSSLVTEAMSKTTEDQ